jgi:glc operon protein GlcG
MFVKSLSLALASVAHKAILTLATAQQIAAQARKIASEHGWPCALAAVAVVQP